MIRLKDKISVRSKVHGTIFDEALGDLLVRWARRDRESKYSSSREA